MLREGQARPQAAGRGGSLRGIAACLIGGRMQRRNLAVQRRLAGGLQSLLAGAVAALAGYALAGAFSSQPCVLSLQRLGLGLDLSDLRLAFRVIEPDQQLALFHFLPRANENLADGRRIGCGDDLHLA